MDSITHNRRYLPHELKTRIAAVKLYRLERDVSYVCRRYHVSKSSLMRWNKKYDGTKESLADRSHRPLSPHPNSHTELEMKWIRDYLRRNPGITVPELYGKLQQHKGYSRHPLSLYRVCRKLGYMPAPEKAKKEPYKPKHYDTPEQIGIKWQMDVKFVPAACYVGGCEGAKFYQYTVIDEASRERFIYAYDEHSGYSTVDFVKRAIEYFGYAPKVIQTDNGSEFTNTRKSKKKHAMDVLLEGLGIKHQLIRPRTPRHNGKVERSHRNDQRRFYSWLTFYSLEDLRKQMKAYLKRSNDIPMSVLGWKSPKEKRKELSMAA